MTVPPPAPVWGPAKPPEQWVLVETAPPDGYDDAFGLLTVRADPKRAGGWADFVDRRPAWVLTPSRVLGPLRDAATAGARLTTWRILAAALPPLLAMPKPPPGTPDLLTLAADTAVATGCRIEVPGLAETAARAGSGRLVTEARRLARALE